MKLQRMKNVECEAYLFSCPGCQMDHIVYVSATPEYIARCGRLPFWGFTGGVDSPTFVPSLLVRWSDFPTEEQAARILAGEQVELAKNVCHSFITDGKVRFLDDCTHAMKGKTVSLAEVNDEPS